MSDASIPSLEIVVFVTPHFNLSASASFIDPFRIANYLSGVARFSWAFVSENGGRVEASNGMVVETKPFKEFNRSEPWLVLVSSSWTPERHASRQLRTMLQRWDRSGTIIGGLDTGAIILAKATESKWKTEKHQLQRNDKS